MRKKSLREVKALAVRHKMQPKTRNGDRDGKKRAINIMIVPEEHQWPSNLTRNKIKNCLRATLPARFNAPFQ
jgi:hypothetical protein